MKPAFFYILLLGLGIGNCLSSRACAAEEQGPGSLVLPEVVAWKEIVWSNDDPNPNVSVNLIDKNRWRIEAKDTALPKTLVVVFDGSQLSASNSRATVALDPRPAMDKVFGALARGHVVGVEQRDGHNCWHVSTRGIGVTGDVWVDTKTHFPVYLEGTLADGSHVRGRYTLLNLDFKGDGSRYFSAGSTTSLFSSSLVP